MALTIDEICSVFRAKGGVSYAGEPVTQLEHALQTATLAEQAGASPALISAALLHDLGHLLNDQGETPTAQGIDDTHQYFVIPFLHGVFAEAVLAPIRLHVDAKRFLCATEPGYYVALSEDSKRSLQLQGGTYSQEEAQAFADRPYASDAIQLRRWDDKAKVAGQQCPSLEYFAGMLKASRLSSRGN